MKFVEIENTLRDMNDDFPTWVQEKIDSLGWSQSEAARRGEISSQMINAVVNRQANPGLEFCRGISRAFQIPLEDVFRKAGILPPQTRAENARRKYQVGNYVMTERFVELFERLGAEQQDLVIRLLESMAQQVEPRIVGEAPPEEEEGK